MKQVPLPTTKTFQQTCLAQVGTNITSSEQSFALQTFFCSPLFLEGLSPWVMGSMRHAIDEIRHHWDIASKQRTNNMLKTFFFTGSCKHLQTLPISPPTHRRKKHVFNIIVRKMIIFSATPNKNLAKKSSKTTKLQTPWRHGGSMFLNWWRILGSPQTAGGPEQPKVGVQASAFVRVDALRFFRHWGIGRKNTVDTELIAYLWNTIISIYSKVRLKSYRKLLWTKYKYIIYKINKYIHNWGGEGPGNTVLKW